MKIAKSIFFFYHGKNAIFSHTQLVFQMGLCTSESRGCLFKCDFAKAISSSETSYVYMYVIIIIYIIIYIIRLLSYIETCFTCCFEILKGTMIPILSRRRGSIPVMILANAIQMLVLLGASKNDNEKLNQKLPSGKLT